MDKLKVVIIVLIIFSIGFVILNFTVSKTNSDFINIVRGFVIGSFGGGESGDAENNLTAKGGGGSLGGESSGGGGSMQEIKEKLDIDENSLVECNFIQEADYVIEGDQMNITIENSSGSFKFQKVKLQQYIKPDSPDILLEYQVLPENADNVLYSNLFFSSDADIYLCY